MGYTGSAAGLLDADTNMTYAVKYLAGAYRVASGNLNRAVHYYAAGYYYAAKNKNLTMASNDQASGVVCFGCAGQQQRQVLVRTEAPAGAIARRKRCVVLEPLQRPSRLSLIARR